MLSTFSDTDYPLTAMPVRGMQEVTQDRTRDTCSARAHVTGAPYGMPIA